MKIVCCVEGLGSYAGVEALLVSVRFGLLAGMMQSWKCMRIALVNGRFPTKRNYISPTHSYDWLYIPKILYPHYLYLHSVYHRTNKQALRALTTPPTSKSNAVTLLFTWHCLMSPKWKTIPKDMIFIVYFGPLCTSKRLRRSKYRTKNSMYHGAKLVMQSSAMTLFCIFLVYFWYQNLKSRWSAKPMRGGERRSYANSWLKGWSRTNTRLWRPDSGKPTGTSTERCWQVRDLAWSTKIGPRTVMNGQTSRPGLPS